MEEMLQKIYEFALAKEEEAAAFYEVLAAAVNRRHISKLFQEFAEAERAHKQVFAKLVAEGRRQGVHPSAAVADRRLSDYLIDVPYDPEMNFQDALIVAMKREEKSHGLYLDLARKVSDPAVAETLRTLADEEGRHKSRLEELYEREVMTED